MDSWLDTLDSPPTRSERSPREFASDALAQRLMPAEPRAGLRPRGPAARVRGPRLRDGGRRLFLGLCALWSLAASRVDATLDPQAYQAESIRLRNAIQQQPQEPQLRRELGALYLAWGKAAPAEKELRKAIELGMPRDRVQFELAESLLMQGRFQEILDDLAPLALMSETDQARLLAYRGDAWLGLARIDKAKTEYQTALNMAPESSEARLGLARIALTENDREVARKLIAEVVAKNPEDAKAWSLQGALYESMQQPEQAEASYSKAIELKPYSPVEHASRALVRVNLGKFQEAEADLEVLKREAPQLFLTHYVDGVLSLRQGRYAEAQSSLEKAEKLNERFRSVQYFLGVAHLYQQHYFEADKYLSAFVKSQSDAPLEPRLFLATVKLRIKQPGAARALLDGVLKTQPEHPLALKLMSEVEIAEGNVRKGLEYADRAAKLATTPASTAASGQLGEKLLQANEVAEVLASLEKNGLNDDQITVQLADIVLGRLSEGNFKGALGVIQQIQRKAPNHYLGDQLAGLAFLAQGDPGKARANFERALTKSPGNPAISHQLAQLALRNKNIPEARAYYEKALQTHPGDLATRIHLAELAQAAGNETAMEEELSTLIRDFPAALQPRLILATHHLARNRPDRAQSLLEAGLRDHKGNTAYLMLLTQAQLENRDFAKAVATARDYMVLAPKSPMTHFLLARAYAGVKETQKMRAELQEALKLDPTFLPARITLVKLLLSEQRLAEAKSQIKLLTQEHPNSPEVLDLQAALADRERDPQAALNVAETAHKARPSARSVTLLAKAQRDAGHGDEAIKTLGDWIAAHPKQVEPRLAVAELLGIMKRDTEAAKHLETVLRLDPRNALALNNLAWLYRHSQPDRAHQLATQAAEVSPNSASVLDTLALIELDRGNTDGAVTLLQRAAKLAPRHASIRYHWALALARGRRPSEALDLLKDLTQDSGTFPERAEAEALLQQLSAR